MEQETAVVKVPPYIPYRTFKTFIEDVRENGVPLRLDTTSLRRFGGSVRNQLISGLRFLGLLNENNETQPDLEILKVAEEPEEWKPRLESLLREAYGPIMELDLARITPSHLNEEFKKQYNAKDEVNRKCVTFFLHAAKDAGIELSPRLLKSTRAAPRRTASANRKKGDSEQKGSTTQESKTSASTNGESYQERNTPSDVTRMPIPLGLGRLAYIELPRDWKSNELKKLISMLELMLSEDVV